MRLVAFLGVVLLVVVGVHGYLWWRLVKSTTRPGRWRRVGTVAMVALAALIPATMVGNRTLPTDLKTPVSLVGYLWLAVMFYLLVYLLVLEVPRMVAWGVRRARAAAAREPALAAVGGGPADDARSGDMPAVADPGRRLFLGRTLAATAGVAAFGTVGFGVRTATGPIPVKHVPITLDRLPAALDGFRIALLSDIHLGATARREFLDGVVRTVNGLDTGLVAIVGDLVDGDVAELGPDTTGLRDLESRHGTYFVTGNHEYISGAAQWVEYLPTLGVRVLHNELETIGEGGATFALAGVDDRVAEASGESGHGTDFDAALAHRGQNQPVVMLAHQPVLFAEAARREVDLQLSGHTQRADGPVQLPGAARPASRGRAVPGRRQPAVRDARRRHMGSTGPGRRTPGDHGRGTTGAPLRPVHRPALCGNELSGHACLSRTPDTPISPTLRGGEPGFHLAAANPERHAG